MARSHGLISVLARPGARQIGLAALRVERRGQMRLYSIWLDGAPYPVEGDWTLDPSTGEFLQVGGEEDR